MNKLTKILIVSAIYVITAYRWIIYIDHPNIFDDVINGFLTFIATVVFILVLSREISSYRLTKKIRSFTLTLVGLCVLSLSIIIRYHLQSSDRSPIILSCVSRYNDFNGMSIEFRKNRTFKMTKWLMGEDVFRGTYELHDSLIIMDSAAVANKIRSNRLIIRDGNNDEGKRNERLIYQVDIKGQIIPNATEFRVVSPSK